MFYKCHRIYNLQKFVFKIERLAEKRGTCFLFDDVDGDDYEFLHLKEILWYEYIKRVIFIFGLDFRLQFVLSVKFS
jgi:hypothetical protein